MEADDIAAALKHRALEVVVEQNAANTPEVGEGLDVATHEDGIAALGNNPTNSRRE